MTTFNRNDVWRIKRCQGQLEKALDSLTRASGELRPKQFTDLRSHLQHAINVTEHTVEMMAKITSAPAKEKPAMDLDLDDEGQEAAE